MGNKYLKLRKIKDFNERYISLNHILEIRFSGIDETKVKIVGFGNAGDALESYGGRSNIELYIKLFNGEEIAISLSEYYVELETVNKIQDDLKHYMKLDRY